MKCLYITLGALALAACSSTPQERMVDTSPKCMSTSPDLQFAVDKAMLQAKSVLADRLKGQTSVLARSYATQHGNTVTRSDDKTIKSVAKDVDLSGYEVAESKVLPDEGSYRAYVLLRYVPASSGDLDKAMNKLDGMTAAPPVVRAVPKGMEPVPAPGPQTDELPVPAAAPRERVTAGTI